MLAFEIGFLARLRRLVVCTRACTEVAAQSELCCCSCCYLFHLREAHLYPQLLASFYLSSQCCATAAAATSDMSREERREEKSNTINANKLKSSLPLAKRGYFLIKIPTFRQ